MSRERNMTFDEIIKLYLGAVFSFCLPAHFHGLIRMNPVTSVVEADERGEKFTERSREGLLSPPHHLLSILDI